MRLEIEDFVSGSPEHESELTRAIKENYDTFYALYSISEGSLLPKLTIDRLSKLHVESPDCEQIWQQVSSSQAFVQSNVKQEIADLESLISSNARSVDSGTLAADQEDKGSFEDLELADSDELGSEEGYNDELESNDEDPNSGKDGDNENVDDESVVDKDMAVQEQERTEASLLDDKFFKLSDMERFLDEEDRQDEKTTQEINENNFHDDDENEDDDDEEMIDYFSNMAGTEDDQATYNDFFDPPSKRVKFKDSDSGAKKRDLFGDNDQEADLDDANNKSFHEQRMEKYKERIAELEEQNLADKPWQLTGEVTAQSRPENSLLEELVDFEASARPPPEITADKTALIEKVVYQRVKDKAFNDVERKVRPKEQPFEYRKRLLIDQDKSKLSLAEVYEQEYLKQVRSEKEEERNPQHDEIRQLMKTVFSKLDLLAHHTLTPDQSSSELKIVHNTPAVQVEEAVPVALADSGQLAPEEVHKVKPSMEKATSERTKTDKLRQRRKKKAKAKAIAAIQTNKLAPDSKEKALLDLKKAARANQTIKIVKERRSEPSAKMTTSTFFSKLQENADSKQSSRSFKQHSNTDTGSSGVKFKL